MSSFAADWLRQYADSRVDRESVMTVNDLRRCAELLDKAYELNWHAEDEDYRP